MPLHVETRSALRNARAAALQTRFGQVNLNKARGALERLLQAHLDWLLEVMSPPGAPGCAGSPAKQAIEDSAEIAGAFTACPAEVTLEIEACRSPGKRGAVASLALPVAPPWEPAVLRAAALRQLLP